VMEWGISSFRNSQCVRRPCASLMQIKIHQRISILGLVLVLHIVVFYVLGNFLVFETPGLSVQEKSDGFLRIALPPKIAPPPPPTDMPKPFALLVPNGVPSPMPVVAITAAPKFNVPIPNVSAQGMADHFSLLDKTKIDTGTQTTDNEPATKPAEKDAPGNNVDIDGLKVPANTAAVVIIDSSSSMHDVLDYIQRTCTKLPMTTDVTLCDGCTGRYVIGDTQQHGMHGLDFYKTAYDELQNSVGGKPPEALIMLSDWEDGAHPEATAAFIASLREHKIRLYLLSVECVPYDGLADYAKESGGQVTMTSKLAIIARK
jgi:hypothetical protein